MMKNQQEMLSLLKQKKIPILVLDQKWHRLFAIHGKPKQIQELESTINSLLARQGSLKTRLKQLKKVKNSLMDDIVQHMNANSSETEESNRQKTLEKNRKLIDETNEEIGSVEDELLEIPNRIKETNEHLMLESMDYFYEKLRLNREEAAEIEEWINQVRIELKKNIIRKQNREINNREIYSYLHDIFGAEVLDLLDPEYDEQQNRESERKNHCTL